MTVRLVSKCSSTEDSVREFWFERLRSLSPKCPYNPEVPIVLSEAPPEKVTLVVVGEAPGKEEVEQGRPFVGRAGRLLREILEREGVLAETHFTNTSSWRPPRSPGTQGDERPGIAVVRSQQARLFYELSVTHPRAILALGKTASESLIPGEFHRGVVENLRVAGRDIPVFATWHPAYIFRAPEFYPDIVRDVQRALALEVPREADGDYLLVREVPPRFVGKYITVDIETANTLPSSEILCAAVRDEERTYLFNSGSLSLLQKSFAEFSGRVVAHSSFDEWILRRHGINVTVKHDTLLLHLALDNRRGSHSLKTLAPVYGGRSLVSTVIPNEGADNVWEDTSDAELYRYCAADAAGTRDLFHALVKMSNCEERRLYHFLRRAARPLAEATARGILIDRPALAEALAEKERTVQEFHDSFNFDPDSSLQTVQALKAAGHDVDSSAEAVLHRLQGDLPKQILEYREQSKIVKAFLRPLSTEWIAEDGAAHPRFLLHGTSTGRLSARDPNVQQVPEGLRHFFVARPGHQFIAWDLRGAEVRAIAYYSQDEQLCQMLRNNLDPHQAVSNATGLTRQQGKTLVFASVYGAGMRKLQDSLGVDIDTIQRGLDVVDKMFPRLRRWKAEVIDFVNEHGYVETPFARKIMFPYQDSRTAWRAQRQACNALPQSLASDTNLITLIRAYELAKLPPLITVHDSVILECLDEEVDTKIQYLKEILADPLPNPYVRFETDMKVGKNWKDLYEP